MDRMLALADDGPHSGVEAVSTHAPLTVEAIYDAHFDFVWRSLRRMGVAPERLDDASQDVFLVVHRRLPDFAQRSSVKTWLFGIAVHVARDHCRSQRRKARVIRDDLPDHPDSVADAVSRGPLQRAEQAEAIEAQRALSSGQAARALELLDQHARAFPRGALSEERNAAHVIALCKLGRTTQARSEAKVFVKNSPRSPLSQRMRSTCGESVVPTAARVESP